MGGWGWGWVVGLAGNKATQPSLAGAWAELGNKKSVDIYNELFFIVHTYFLTSLLRTPLCFSKIDRTRDIRQLNQKGI